MKKRLAAALSVVALGVGAAVAPAASAAPGGGNNAIGQVGLVNVAVNDVNILNDVAIGVGVSVAANVCGTQVNAAVLAEQIIAAGPEGVTCENDDTGNTVTVTT
jgi:hypothetical protein